MKLNTVKKICLNFTLDSSEAIMFMKGGAFTHKLDYAALSDIEGWTRDEGDHESHDTEIIITFQAEKCSQARTEWTTKEAEKSKLYEAGISATAFTGMEC